MGVWCSVVLSNVGLFVGRAPVVGAHEVVTPVTFLCARSKEEREFVFCRRTCQGLEVVIVLKNERVIKVRARQLSPKVDSERN